MFKRNRIIRHLALVFTLMVWMLSTLPCFVADECICRGCTCACADGDDCGQTRPCDCCSPFIHCNTCAGCTVPACLQADIRVEINDRDDIPLYHEDEYLSRYTSSIWQPPRA